MKPRRPFKELGLVFTAALVLYLGAYFLIEHWRQHLGPWTVTFTRQTNGTPALVINQSTLAITNVTIEFPGAEPTNSLSAETISFGKPKPVPYDTPFGECVFMDTTFQPGTVVFKAFGHEIQLIRRVLTIDNFEHAWRSGDHVSITAINLSSPTNSPH
jgi:hypothetical protein